MSNNERIGREIEFRLRHAEERLSGLCEELAPLGAYYRAQSMDWLVRLVYRELVDCFVHWRADQPLSAAGFEWYYDGSEPAEALGYGYAKTDGTLTFAAEPNPEEVRPRDDFLGGLELRNLLFGDSAGVDVKKACFPLYECRAAGLAPEADDDWDALTDAFTLRMFLALHRAAERAVRSPRFTALDIQVPFTLWANNHDWSPFLLYAVEERGQPGEGADEDATISEEVDLTVPELSAWLEGVEQARARAERKKALLSGLRDLPAADWQRVLVGLPKVAAPEGDAVELELDDLRHLGSQYLSAPTRLREISFDAFAHLFRLLCVPDEYGYFHIDYAMVYLFVNDPKRALELTRETAAGDSTLATQIQSSAKNLLRWADDDPESRWDNPVLTLSRSGPAKAALRELIGG